MRRTSSRRGTPRPAATPLSHRNRVRQGLLGAAVLALCAGCGSSPGFTSGDLPSTPPPTARPAAASSSRPSPATPAGAASPVAASPAAAVSAACVRKLSAWRGTPGAQALTRARPMLRSATLAERAQDYSSAVTDLNQLAVVTVTLQSHPVPRCADHRHYWHRMTRAIQGAVSLTSLIESASPPAVEQASTDTARASADARSIVRETRK